MTEWDALQPSPLFTVVRGDPDANQLAQAIVDYQCVSAYVCARWRQIDATSHRENYYIAHNQQIRKLQSSR